MKTDNFQLWLTMLSTKVLLPLLMVPFVSVDFGGAIPGEYFTTASLGNKWLPNPLDTKTVTTTYDCMKICYKHYKCNGYAVSTFERKCRLYDITNGVPPVKNNGYTLFIKKKTREEGYYEYGMNYIRLMREWITADEAEKVCQKEKGTLVNIRNNDVNNLIGYLMTRHSVWTAFIGLRRPTVDGKWKYADGGPVVFERWTWDGNFPRMNFLCAKAILTIDGVFWRHANCQHRNYFFCQVPMF